MPNHHTSSLSHRERLALAMAGVPLTDIDDDETPEDWGRIDLDTRIDTGEYGDSLFPNRDVLPPPPTPEWWQQRVELDVIYDSANETPPRHWDWSTLANHAVRVVSHRRAKPLDERGETSDVALSWGSAAGVSVGLGLAIGVANWVLVILLAVLFPLAWWWALAEIHEHYRAHPVPPRPTSLRPSGPRPIP